MKSGKGHAAQAAAYDPNNVMALLERAAYLEGGAERKTLRRQQRMKELAEDDAFLAAQARDTKAQHAANVKEALQPYSAEVASNYESIQTMLSETGAESPDAAHTSAALATSGGPDGVDDSVGFEVDDDFAVARGQVQRPPPSAGGDDDGGAHGLTSNFDGEDDDDAYDLASSSRADMWDVKDASTIGRRKATRTPQPQASENKFRKQLNSLLAPPPETVTYKHELAHVFNMLDSNNIVLVATEEVAAAPGATGPEFENKLCVLSPTNGMRLRKHLDTPDGEPNLLYTSQGWVVRQSLLGALLQGRIDFEHLARLHTALETAFTDAKRADALVRKKDATLARERARSANLQRTTETLVARNRLRRAFLVQLAMALKSAHQKQEDERVVSATPAATASRARGAYLADFILRQDQNAASEEASALGGTVGTVSGGGAQPEQRGFSSFEELQQAVSAYEDVKQRDPAAVDSWMSVTSQDLEATTYGGAMESSMRGGGPPRYGGVPDHAAVMASLVGQQSHDALLRKLHQKIEVAQRRRNFERRMELMERAAMEGEDTISAVNTIFKIGEKGFARVRDIMAAVPSDVLHTIVGKGSLMHQAPLADAGQQVICPCCKFEFDPSKPASDYKEAILARQRKAREAMAAKSAAAQPPSAQAMHKGKGPKTVVPGNIAGGSGGAGEGQALDKQTPKKGKGKSETVITLAAPVSDDGMFAIMALQETIDEQAGQMKELEAHTSELEAEIEMARLSAAAALNKAEQMTVELTKENEELKVTTHEAVAAKVAVEKVASVAQNESKALELKLEQLEKASESAFENLERRELDDRRLGEIHRSKMKDATDGGAATWEELAKLYNRRFHEAKNQLARLGSTFADLVDVYCGGDEELREKEHRVTQTSLIDAGIDPEELVSHVDIQAMPDTRERGAGRTPRGSTHYAAASTQTGGVQLVMKPLLKSERQAAHDEGWKDDQGEGVHSVLMRRDIYSQLLRASDYSDVMRDYIKQLELKDKEEQAKHADELAKLTKAHSKEVKTLGETLAKKSAALDKLRAEHEAASKELKEAVNLAATLKKDLGAQRTDNEKLRNDLKHAPPNTVTVKEQVPVHVPQPGGEHISGSGADPGGNGGSGQGLEAATDADAYVPYEQIYRPTGVGRAVVRRVHARTLGEIEVDEQEMRRQLEGQYVAFTIPLPMLGALIADAKAQVRDIVRDAETRGRQREERVMRESVRVTELLLGQDLGVSNRLPGWYQSGIDANASSLRPGDHHPPGAHTSAHDGSHREPGSIGYRVLQGRELQLPSPTERDPVTGALQRQRPHGGAGASLRALSPSILHGDEQPMARSTLFKHGHVRSAPPELQLAGLLQRMSASLAHPFGIAAHELSLLSSPEGEHDGAGDADQSERLSVPVGGAAPKFSEATRRVHNLTVDGSLLASDAKTGELGPSSAEVLAARQRTLESLRQQRIAEIEHAATKHNASRDGGPILESILRSVSPAASPKSVISPAREHEPQRHGELPALRTGTALMSEPDKVPPTYARLSGGALDAPPEGRVEQLSLMMLRGRAGPPGQESEQSSPRAWGRDHDLELRQQQEREASRRVDRLIKKNASEARRIRGIRTGAASAPLTDREELDPIVGRPPVVNHGGGPRNHRGPHPDVHSAEARGEEAWPERRDVLAVPRDVAPLGLSQGMTGAARGSIAVKRPLAQRHPK